jgi:hypothetical protein
MPLQGFQVKSNGSDRSLEFVGYGIDETIVLLVQFDFTDQEARIQDQSKDNRGKEQDTEKQKHTLPPVEDDPSNVQGDGQSDQTNA